MDSRTRGVLSYFTIKLKCEKITAKLDRNLIFINSHTTMFCTMPHYTKEKDLIYSMIKASRRYMWKVDESTSPVHVLYYTIVITKLDVLAGMHGIFFGLFQTN